MTYQRTTTEVDVLPQTDWPDFDHSRGTTTVQKENLSIISAEGLKGLEASNAAKEQRG